MRCASWKLRASACSAQSSLVPHPAQRVLIKINGWSVIGNRYPYKGARLHLLLIPTLDVSDILALAPDLLAGLDCAGMG
jgi:hypothetical protein